MMWNSYIALLGDPESLDQVAPRETLSAFARETGLIEHRSTERMRLLASPRVAVTAIGNASGMIIGTLHPRGPEQHDVSSPAAGVGIVESGGTRLIDHYWGAYLAVIDDRRKAVFKALRDPSPAWPCYILRTGDVTILTGDLALIEALGLWTPRVDEEGLLRSLLAPNFRNDRTALSGVLELLPGRSIRLRGGNSQTMIWDPWAFAAPDVRLHCPDAAATALRRTVTGTIAAQCRDVDHVLLSLSGGLDSSILAAGLSEANIPFTPVNFATRAKAGDERSYARDLCRSLGVDLVEAQEDAAVVALGQSSAAHLPRPCSRFFAQSADRQQRAIAEKVGADAFMHGGGGDNVFAYLRSVTPVVDRWRDEGLRGAWTTAREMAMLAECSTSETLVGAMKRAWRGGNAYRWSIDDRLLATRDASGTFLKDQQWLETPPDAYPGKAMHIAFLLGVHNRLEGYLRERDHPMIAPLMAQPVVELCLRIPTWMWCAGGHNRAIARLAFHDRLPARIRDRRSKGTPGSLVFEIFEAQRERIVDDLLGGELAARRLLDRDAIERAAKRADLDVATCNRLMTLFDAEIWVRSWRR